MIALERSSRLILFKEYLIGPQFQEINLTVLLSSAQTVCFQDKNRPGHQILNVSSSQHLPLMIIITHQILNNLVYLLTWAGTQQISASSSRSASLPSSNTSLEYRRNFLLLFCNTGSPGISFHVSQSFNIIILKSHDFLSKSRDCSMILMKTQSTVLS